MPAGTVVRVKFKDKKQFRTCYAKDISNNGIFLRTNTPLPVFDKVTVVLELPTGQTVELHGEVVHAISVEKASTGAAPGMGVQFGDLTPEKRALLEEYLERCKTVPPADRLGGTDGRTMRPGAAPPLVNASLEEMVQGLRRLLWLCADATQLVATDYYQLLGIDAQADTDKIRGACAVLRILVDPATAPAGLEANEAGRFSALLMIIADIEDCLTDARRRAAYDEARAGILR